MMYIVQVQNLEGTKMKYYRARNLTEAKLFQMSSTNFVHIYSAQDFLSRLQVVPINPKVQDNFDVTL